MTIVSADEMEQEVLRLLADGDPDTCFGQRYVDSDFDAAKIGQEAGEVAGEGPLPRSEGWVGDLNGAAVSSRSVLVVKTPEESPSIAWFLMPVTEDGARGIEIRSIPLADGRTVWVTTGNSITVVACQERE